MEGSTEPKIPSPAATLTKNDAVWDTSSTIVDPTRILLANKIVTGSDGKFSNISITVSFPVPGLITRPNCSKGTKSNHGAVLTVATSISNVLSIPVLQLHCTPPAASPKFLQAGGLPGNPDPRPPSSCILTLNTSLPVAPALTAKVNRPEGYSTGDCRKTSLDVKFDTERNTCCRASDPDSTSPKRLRYTSVPLLIFAKS
mmetsp:Transcript_19538/g.41016  ORF Transcript_19538/g.41016 Transcript_19538/m.41016 type:complete len:200 (-) Transcript_19538:922-1521(-)